MSYANKSITELLRGPLLRTPQGLVVLGVCAVYLGLLPLSYAGIFQPFGKSNSVATLMCLAWPFITFLAFIWEGSSTTPEFKPSVIRTIWLVICGMAPLLFYLKDKFFN